MIGRVSGSQLARMVPALMVWSALTASVAPYGTLWRSRSRPCSSWMTISPERRSPPAPLAVGHVAHGGVEADHAVGLGFHAGGDGRTRGRATDVEGRIVSCVPGSPIDWAAITPTAARC